MKLRTRMALNMGLVVALFIVALIVALTGMQSIKSRFETFVGVDQKLLEASNAMYAQGLQMGQALRNIVMDPENVKGYANFDKAAKDFEQANLRAMQLSAADRDAQGLLKQVQALRVRQSEIQRNILSMAKQDQAGAIAAIRAHETPAWREMRALLLDFIDRQRVTATGVQQSTIAHAGRMLTISVALALLAVAAGAVLMTLLVRRVMTQLGGEPDYAARVAASIAGGDLTGTVQVRSGDRSSLMFAMHAMQERLAQTLEGIRRSADTIDVASREIAAGNADLSSRTESQAASLEETASSMQQLTGTVRLNAEHARAANQLAADASSVAAKGGGIVAQVVDTMASIRDSSRRVVDIISVIDGIAFQTNILALNAAVEAARAGEQGRGFAVVAGEVRTLAQRSAAAAKEIKHLIGDSVTRVDTGSKLVNDAGMTMQQIVDAIKRVSDLVEDIASASEEQSSGIEQVNQAVLQMDDVTQQNAALVEQAAAAAHSLQDQAHRLSEEVAQFKIAPTDTAIEPVLGTYRAPVAVAMDETILRPQLTSVEDPKMHALAA